MSAGARSLYVYYRVAHADLARTAAIVRTIQQDLCARHAGLQAQLLQRVDERGGPGGEATPEVNQGRSPPAVTLMEVYLSPRGVDGALLAEIEAAARAAAPVGRVGDRHVEWFQPYR